MNLCLLFHCLCESYDDVPERVQDLFVLGGPGNHDCGQVLHQDAAVRHFA